MLVLTVVRGTPCERCVPAVQPPWMPVLLSTRRSRVLDVQPRMHLICLWGSKVVHTRMCVCHAVT